MSAAEQPLDRAPVSRVRDHEGWWWWARCPLSWPGRRRMAAAAAASAVVLLLDAVQAAGPWPVGVVGVLDEPAHLLTAWLVLTAALPRRVAALWPWALLGAVVIDADHVPFYLWGVGAVAAGGRPVTHSLLTVAVLLVAGLLWRRARVACCGLAAGVLLHLVRDSATGPGVPLLWPADEVKVLLPYGAYALVLALATVAAVRPARGDR